MGGKSILSRKRKGKKEKMPSRRHVAGNFLLECKAKRRTGEAKRAQGQEQRMGVLKEYSPSLGALENKKASASSSLSLSLKETRGTLQAAAWNAWNTRSLVR